MTISVLNLGPLEISQEQLFGSFDMIANETGHLDGESICEWHRRCDQEALDGFAASGRRLPRALGAQWTQWQNDAENRGDALPAGVTAFPRELEFIRARELEQVRKPLSAERLFPIDRSVPVGVRTHTYRRKTGRGEAVITRGDTQNYGHARTGRLEQSFPVAYIICSVRQTYFEMLSTDYAGIQQYSNDLREAYQIVDEKKNRILWNGDVGTGLRGVLNFPGLMKKVMWVTFGGASTTSAELLTAALHSLVDAPATYSGEAMAPDTLVVSPKIWRHIAQTMLNTAGNGVTIKNFFLAGQDSEGGGIKRIIKAQELAGIGPNGEDGILAFKADLDSVSNVEVLPTMTMPVYQATALSWITLVIAGTGGITMPNAGNNILGLAATG